MLSGREGLETRFYRPQYGVSGKVEVHRIIIHIKKFPLAKFVVL
jgi:hypothetical protein